MSDILKLDFIDTDLFNKYDYLITVFCFCCKTSIRSFTFLNIIFIIRIIAIYHLILLFFFIKKGFSLLVILIDQVQIILFGTKIFLSNSVNNGFDEWYF